MHGDWLYGLWMWRAEQVALHSSYGCMIAPLGTLPVLKLPEPYESVWCENYGVVNINVPKHCVCVHGWHTIEFPFFRIAQHVIRFWNFFKSGQQAHVRHLFISDGTVMPVTEAYFSAAAFSLPKFLSANVQRHIWTRSQTCIPTPHTPTASNKRK